MQQIEILEWTGTPFGALVFDGMRARGRVAPRLELVFDTQPALGVYCTLEDAQVRVEWRDELLGVGHIMDIDLAHNNTQVVEVPTNAALLRHVTSGLDRTARVVEMNVVLSGRGRYRYTSEDHPRSAASNPPAIGEDRDFKLARRAVKIQVPRGDWFGEVLEATDSLSYVYMELALPSPAANRKEWEAALGNFRSAERAFSEGDDAGVFFYLRGSYDALPGAKQEIVQHVRDEGKRAALDRLLREAAKYLHLGRHVAATGEEAGTFPVDHLDAAFALDLMRVVLAHLSLILASELRRKAN